MSEDAGQGPGRRDLLRCMAWAGTGALFSFSGGVASSMLLDEAAAAPRAASGFSFVQLSDSHIGFARPPNPDARVTLAEAVAKVRALPEPPAFILHTGDISQLSKPAEWDDADQILAASGARVFHVPGEHDMLDEGNGRAYLERYGRDAEGDGWYAFDHGGVHFVALVNVKNLQAGGMGRLGDEQLAWLERDLRGRRASTPIVVFAHIPLWILYADWGWGTDDGVRALGLLRRFGSVTVLNGHVHQLAQKVEGQITFHTARSTAFPQPAPGTAPAPGPLVTPADQLRRELGLRTLRFVRRDTPIALADASLAV